VRCRTGRLSSCLCDNLALADRIFYRANSFYTVRHALSFFSNIAVNCNLDPQKENPPFAVHMTDFLVECFARGRRPQVVQSLMNATDAKANTKFEEDIAFMANICDESTCASFPFISGQ
jgi:hypothetical protein